MSRWASAFFAAVLAGGPSCLPALAADAGPAGTRFESSAAPDGQRVVIICAKAAPTAAVPCGVGSQTAKAAPPGLSLEFLPLTDGQSYLAELAREAADAQARDLKVLDGIPPTAADVAVLKQVAKDPSACLAERNSADLLLACPTGRHFEDAVVMLFRGLCDRCEFQPIVVRKVN